MELVFPFKNITINTLWDFFELEKVKEFADTKTENGAWKEEYFNVGIETWRDSLPDFENEILQIVNTTDQKTNDLYFDDLGMQIKNLHSHLSKEFFTQSIAEWNAELLKKYNEAVEKKSEE